MASIESLLNPVPSEPARRRQEWQEKLHQQQQQQQRPNTFPPDISERRPSRTPKDAPVFNPGKVRGELRYAPFEERDEFLDEQHVLFEIHPAIGHIADFPRHIPYSSEKKGFLEKTGRESFEVFQYTFKIPNMDKAWTVMWDYNIGLVRTTHLFKCNNYSKTTPAKMLNSNPGLREICHSITGGALAAQGYWMPYEAAKAVSATFCWSIRYALTPLFGKDFPSMCIPPGNPQFGKMVVDPEIVRRSTETAYQYRKQELELKMKTQQQHHHQGQQPVSMEVSSFRRDGFGNSTSHTSSREEECSFSPTTTSTTTTTTASGNLWTPINPLPTERTKPVRRSEKRTTTTGMLPPIKDMFHTHTKGSHASQANPLKRRLNENNTEKTAAVESPSSSSSAAGGGGKSRGNARQARKSYSYDESSDEDEEEDLDNSDADDDDDINLDRTTDEDDSSSSSDSDSDLDLISDLSMQTSSDDSEGGENDDNSERRRRRRRRCRPHGHSKLQQRKKSQQGMKHDSTLSSTTSPPPVPQPQQPLISKQNHHPRDREAAEALLTLSSRSGSSCVEERPADSMKQTAKNGKDQVGQKEMTDGAASNTAAAVSKKHTIKRLRRASF